MGLYLAICYLFLVAKMVTNLETSPRLEVVEQIKLTDGKKYLPVPWENCSYHNGKFSCKDQKKCINLIDTCNGKCNCFDCSDESDQCWIHDEYLCQSCYDLCIPTPDGPQCLCEFSNHNIGLICRELTHCSKHSPCDQRCVQYGGVERCSCDENYSARPNTFGRVCTSNAPKDNLLVYSTNDQLKVYHLYSGKASVIQNNVHCKGLSASGDYCFHGAIEKNTGYVLRTSIIDGQTDLGFETHSKIIFSIDVDWITENVYFSTDKSIGVCSQYGYVCAEVKSLINLADYCYISLAPRSGLLFYSLKSRFIESRIMKSSMDGSDDVILVSENSIQPVSLTVDESSQMVYWLDAGSSKIESILFNGENRKVWFINSRMNLFAMSELENHFFWTRGNMNSIGLNNEIDFIIDKNTTIIKYLYAYNPLLQRTKIPNPCIEAPCNGLCVLRQSPMRKLDYACLCTNFTPSKGNHWCSNQSAAGQSDWPPEEDPEYENEQLPSIEPEKTSKWFSSIISAVFYGLLIILTSASVYFIFRRRILYYYDRFWHNRDVQRQEYIEL